MKKKKSCVARSRSIAHPITQTITQTLNHPIPSPTASHLRLQSAMNYPFTNIIDQCIVHCQYQELDTQHSTHSVSCNTRTLFDWSTADTKKHNTMYESNWFALDWWADQH